MPFFRPKNTPDPEQFNELFERYKNLVYKTAYLILDDTAEAEEALQEVFVLVYKSLAQFDPNKSAFSTWLHRITLNYCLGMRRKRRLDCQPIDEDDRRLVGEPVEIRSTRLAEQEAMHQAIRQLSDKQQAVVILRYYWELPYGEIAQVLSIPMGTVKSRIDLALRTLRQILDDERGEVCPGTALEEEIGS